MFVTFKLARHIRSIMTHDGLLRVTIDLFTERVKEFVATWIHQKTADKGEVTMTVQEYLDGLNEAFKGKGVGSMYVPYAGKTYVAALSFNSLDDSYFIRDKGALAKLSISHTFNSNGHFHH